MIKSDPLRSLLLSGLAEMSLQLSDSQVDQLLDYLELLNHWNKKINLTAITDPAEQITKHLLDSYSIYPFVDALLESTEASPIIDIGTGAGLPGIPMAIAQPEREWHLLDNSTKRISFLRVVITQLKLNNVQLINSKVEQYVPERLYPVIVCRAFASLKKITHNAHHLMSPNGSLLAMKGQYPEQEIADMPDTFAVTNSHVLTVPGLLEERHLLEIKRRP